MLIKINSTFRLHLPGALEDNGMSGVQNNRKARAPISLKPILPAFAAEGFQFISRNSVLRASVITFWYMGVVAFAYYGAFLLRFDGNIPPHMFVTCLYAVLDPVSGRMVYANAGHNLPYVATADGVAELRAVGMPLGAMPGMTYEENETYLAPGDAVLFHSDGLVEAHDPDGDMFGFPRLRKLVGNSGGGEQLIEECLAELNEFVGDDWKQEDDITLVTLQRDRG